jgi:hypothetical protein
LGEINAELTATALEAIIQNILVLLAASHPSTVFVNEMVQRLHATLKAQRGTAPTRAELRKMYDAVAAAPPPRPKLASADNSVRQIMVCDCLPDVLTLTTAVVPAGWAISAKGVARLTDDHEEEVLSAPVVISQRLINIADDTEALGLEWKRDGKWQDHIVDRVVVANSREIVKLAAQGLPVTTNNAAAVVQYLADFEAENLSRIEQVQVSHQMGWTKNKTAFLCGHVSIVADTPLSGDDPVQSPAPATHLDDSLDAAPESALSTATIFFRAADTGDQQLAEGFHSQGSFQDWCQIVTPALAFDRVRLAVVASLTAPFLSILQQPNFGVDYCGETSKGKTTTLRLAASVWGRPDEKSPNAALTCWNSTRVHRERASAVLNNLPVIMDETKLVRDKREIASFLYEMANGRGKGRGSVAGTQRTSTWHTVLLTSGEAPATSYSEDGGTKARILTLWGIPFDKSDEPTATLVKKINMELLQHYGHAGPRWVRYLLRNRERWADWRKDFSAIQNDYLKKAGDNAVVGRLSDAFAVLTLTARLAGEALNLPALAQDPIGPLWDSLTGEAAEADRASEALRCAVEWAYAHSGEFSSEPTDFGSPKPPSAGWAGHWKQPVMVMGRATSWDFIGFIPSKLKQVLTAEGFDAEAVVRTWRDRGWLLVDPSDRRKRYHQAMVGNSKANLICFTRQAVEAVEGITQETLEPPPSSWGDPPDFDGTNKSSAHGKTQKEATPKEYRKAEGGIEALRVERVEPRVEPDLP